MKVYMLLMLIAISLSNCKNQNNSTPPLPRVTDPVIDGISTLIASQPNNIDLLYERADLLYLREEYKSAEKDLIKAIELKKDDPKYYHLLADVQLDDYRSKEAISTLKKAIEIFPTRIPTLLKLTEFYYLLKKNDESIATINEIVRQDPQNADAYFMLGLNFRAMQDTTKAMNSLQRSVEIDADMIDAWILLGNIYEDKGDISAIQYYNNAIEIDPNNIEALHSKAYFLQNHENELDAIEIYKRINVLAPTYADAYLNTGILYLSLDSFMEAYSHFNILAGIDPANGMAYYYRGISQELLGNSEQALSDYNSCLNLLPDNEKALQAKMELENLKQ